MKYAKSLLAAVASAAVVLGCASPLTRLSVYRYNVYNNGGYFFGEGRLELREDPDGASMRVVSGTPGVSNCVSVSQKVKVSRDEQFTTIIAEPLYTGCDLTKYEIRNDGKGGTRYAKVNGEWVRDQFDRGLTPKD